MKANIFLLFTTIILYSCGNNNSSIGGASYTNACCCSSIIIAKNSKIHVPSAFTPNDDNVNDYLSIQGDNSVNYITNLQIKDSLGNTIKLLDTVYNKLGSEKNWDGLTTGNTKWEGVVQLSALVTDNANDTITINASTCIYNCNSANMNAISNKNNCSMSDQLNPVDFTATLATNDPCIK